MKKINWVLSVVLIGMVVFMNSCAKDNDDPIVVDKKPTLTFQVGGDYISANTTVTVGTALKFGIRAISNTSSNAKLTNFTIARTFNGITETWDSTFNQTNFTLDIETFANAQPGVETYVFTIKDKDGQMSNLTLLITTTEEFGEINIFSMTILGAQGSSTGSSFASIDGSVYKLADAKTNATKVDWLYYYGATDFATIAAPNDAHAALIFNNATNGLQSWATLNPTLFKLVTDAIDFNAITNDAVIVNQTASGVDQTRITNLQAGKLIAFITHSGKKGILKIESITGTTDGSMTMTVKVQK